MPGTIPVAPNRASNGHGNGHDPSLTDRQLRTLGVLLDRQIFMRMAGVQFDGRRDLYDILGYDRIITSQQYREEYARGGIAKRIVDAYPKATWRGGVEVYEDEDPKVQTTFEKAFADLEKKYHIWSTLQNADILAGLSTYSVILIGAPGLLDQELPKGSPDKLLYLSPFWGGGGPGDMGQGRSTMRTQASDTDVTIETFDKDPASPRFGEPLTYRIRRTDLSSPLLARPVHWSRVIHVAENTLDNRVYGTPTLESVWNLLADLEKVTGGGAESFFQRAKHTLNLNIQKDAMFTDADLADLKNKLDEYQHGITNMIPTREVDVKLIEAAIANFSGPADAILTQMAGTTGIPKRILTGSEMGELASTQDAANFDSQVKDRRTNYAGPMIVRRLVDRLIDYGYLPTPKQYEVGWPVEESMDESGKATFALTLANVNKTQGDTVFTDEEIRDMAFDMEPLSDEQKQAIADKAAEKLQQQQEAMKATGLAPASNQPPANPAQPPAKLNPFAKLKAAEDRAVLRVLETAIRAGDRETVDKILGLETHTYATTQIQLPADVAAKLVAFGRSIPDSDLVDAGRETDAHVTVRYGLTAPDADLLSRIPIHISGGRPTTLGKVQALSLTLGKASFFSAPDYDVVYIDVKSEDLKAVNRSIGKNLPVAPSDYPYYAPHATVAYVKPGTGENYAGWAGLDGTVVVVHSLSLVDTDGNATEVPFG